MSPPNKRPQRLQTHRARTKKLRPTKRERNKGESKGRKGMLRKDEERGGGGDGIIEQKIEIPFSVPGWPLFGCVAHKGH